MRFCVALRAKRREGFFLCFRAKGPFVLIAWAIGPGQCVARVAKPQSGRPFDGDESNCRPVGPSSMINRLLPGPMALAIGTDGPLGRIAVFQWAFENSLARSFATFPDDIRESMTSPISDPRTSFRAEPRIPGGRSLRSSVFRAWSLGTRMCGPLTNTSCSHE